MTKRPIRIVLGSRSALTGSLLRYVLTSAGAQVVCETDRPDRLATLVRVEEPDVVVLESDAVTAPVGQVVRDVTATGVPVLVLCADVAAEGAIGAMAAGASGFLSLELERPELIAAVGAVRRREVPLDPRVAATLVEQWREMRGDGPNPATTGGRLSARELDVLAGMSRGETTKGVARTLGVSVKTIENHKTRIFAKLGVRSQAEAVAVSIGRGLLAPGAGRPDAG